MKQDDVCEDIVHYIELTQGGQRVEDDDESDKRNRRSDWELAHLPTLFARHSRDGETVPYEDLRWALIDQERITPDIADLVIQSAIDDGILARENRRVLRLLESETSDRLEEGNDGQ